MTPDEHPLATLLREAAAGSFPAVDGGWHRVPPWRAGLGAVVAFTGHAVIAADGVPDIRLVELGVDGFGGAHDPRVIAALAGPGGWIDSLDLVLLRHGRARSVAGCGTEPRPERAAQPAIRSGSPNEIQPGSPNGTQPGPRPGATTGRRPGSGPGPRLVSRPDLAEHPRVAFSRAVRADIEVWGYPDPTDQSLVAISAGIGGLTEIGFELDADRRGHGGGARLVEDALRVIPADRLVVTAVAPGNAASVRTLLRCGFTPVASVQLFRRGTATADGKSVRQI